MRNILAVICFALGIIGGFVPLMQGWIFHVLGFILLDFEKKEEVEQKILLFLRKKRWGRGIYLYWIKAKRNYKNRKNRKV